jgi:upstream activation factor subunit UAF30
MAKKKATKKKATKRKATKKKATKKKATKKKATKKKATKKKATKKKATKKKATKKKATKKKATKKKRAPRKPNPAFMKPMQPDGLLSAIVGDKPIPRTEITKKLWAYIKRNGLQDKSNRRMINADTKLRPVFAGRSQVNMFEMTKLVSNHMWEA